ncbi:hypothetical protein AAHK20_14045 [Trinickia sp. YCB016]
MRFEFGDAFVIFFGPIFALLLILTMPRFWIDWMGRILFRFPRQIATLAAIGVLYLVLFNHTSQGTECERSTSPDGNYIAERCLLKRAPGGGNSEYVGRLFDSKNDKLLAELTLRTPVPELSWSDYEGKSVSFSSGDALDNDGSISIPPSKWDRLLAARPRL